MGIMHSEGFRDVSVFVRVLPLEDSIYARHAAQGCAIEAAVWKDATDGGSGVHGVSPKLIDSTVCRWSESYGYSAEEQAYKA